MECACDISPKEFRDVCKTIYLFMKCREFYQSPEVFAEECEEMGCPIIPPVQPSRMVGSSYYQPCASSRPGYPSRSSVSNQFPNPRTSVLPKSALGSRNSASSAASTTSKLIRCDTRTQTSTSVCSEPVVCGPCLLADDNISNKSRRTQTSVCEEPGICQPCVDASRPKANMTRVHGGQSCFKVTKSTSNECKECNPNVNSTSQTFRTVRRGHSPLCTQPMSSKASIASNKSGNKNSVRMKGLTSDSSVSTVSSGR